MKYIIDSYAWIEYLDGTSKGQKLKEILMKENEIYTLGLSITEIISRVKRMDKDVETAYKAITFNSMIVQIDQETAKRAGLFHAEMRKKIKDFGIVDSLIYLIAKKLNAKIITGDEHFRNFKEAIFIK